MKKTIIGLAAVVASSLTAATLARSTSATTEPQTTYFDKVTLTDKKIVLSFTRIERGALVVFTVRNRSKHRRDFNIAQIKSGTIAPRTSTKFELNFMQRYVFTYTSTGSGRTPKLKGTFTVY